MLEHYYDNMIWNNLFEIIIKKTTANNVLLKFGDYNGAYRYLTNREMGRS